MQSKKNKSCSCGTSKHPNLQSMTLQVIFERSGLLCCSPGGRSSKDFDIYFQITTQGLPNTCSVYWAFEAPVIMLKLFWLIKSINRKHFSVLGAHAFSGQEHRVFLSAVCRRLAQRPAVSFQSCFLTPWDCRNAIFLSEQPAIAYLSVFHSFIFQCRSLWRWCPGSPLRRPVQWSCPGWWQLNGHLRLPERGQCHGTADTEPEPPRTAAGGPCGEPVSGWGHRTEGRHTYRGS